MLFRSTTTAKITVFVDAYNEDDAIEYAYSMIDPKEIEFEEWEVDDVSVEYPDND